MPFAASVTSFDNSGNEIHFRGVSVEFDKRNYAGQQQRSNCTQTDATSALTECTYLPGQYWLTIKNEDNLEPPSYIVHPRHMHTV